jgi:hypothetical protein
MTAFRILSVVIHNLLQSFLHCYGYECLLCTPKAFEYTLYASNIYTRTMFELTLEEYNG